MLGCRSCSRFSNYAITFERNVFTKIDVFKNRSCITLNLLVCIVRAETVCGERKRGHTHKATTVTLAAHARRG